MEKGGPQKSAADSVAVRVQAAIAATADGARDQHAGRKRRKPSIRLSARRSAWQSGFWSLGSDNLGQFVPQLSSRGCKGDWQGTELETDFQRAVEQAKLEALKEFAYGAGHEINNPLANISARAQTLLKDEADPERRQKLAAINTQAFRAHEMIADLMLFARPPEMNPQRIELAGFLTDLADSWQAQAAEQQTEIEVHVSTDSTLAGGPLVVWADASALAVALRALVTNALECSGAWRTRGDLPQSAAGKDRPGCPV